MFQWRPRSHTRRIILHDAHSPPSVTSATDWMRTKGRSMGLLEIGYHFVLERDGSVTQPRPHWAIGSHTPGNNHDSIGVCLAGGVESPFTPAQFAALEETVWFLIGKYSEYPFNQIRVLGHYEVQRLRNRPPCPALDMRDLRESLELPRDYHHTNKKPEPALPASA